MRLLLDTHIAIWWITDDPRLSSPARAMMTDSENFCVVSAVSIWEMAIKSALRRGHHDDMQMTGNEAMRDFEAAGFDLIAINPDAAAGIDYLPPIHSDPFDRLLIAQARQEGMTLLTHDKLLAGYGAFVIVA